MVGAAAAAGTAVVVGEGAAGAEAGRMRGRARCFLGPASRAAAGEAAAGGAAAEAAEAGAGTGLPCTQLPRAAPGCFADASASRSLGLFCFGSGWCAPEAVALLCFLPPRWARTSSALSRLNVSAEPQRVHHRWGAPFGVVNGMSTSASVPPAATTLRVGSAVFGGRYAAGVPEATAEVAEEAAAVLSLAARLL